MVITQLNLDNGFTLTYTRLLDEDEEKFEVFAQETCGLLNNKGRGDFVIRRINDRKIILRNETACPCYNEFKINGCAIIEDVVNDIGYDICKRFSARFVSCSKKKQSCCEMLLEFI